ncbi:MAG: Nif3-like dinuclear metal center hexameric protein [Clostridiales bacterium]|jgi:dinuclear metal center YbgI/SA1388 family protein|nr:Nif3-like dinuclear metal center hexameric protein [Clostridiales bacterium]
MPKAADIIRAAETIAPPELSAEWDNSGLIVGRAGADAGRVLVALDATREVCREAAAVGAGLIVTHHPPIFKPIQRVADCDALGDKLLFLIENGIAVYAMHTNLDAADGGTNDTLARLLGLTAIDSLGDPPAMGRVGNIPEPLPLRGFAGAASRALGTDALRFTGDPRRIVKRAAVVTGSGSDRKLFRRALSQGADVFITGDVRYHEAQDAIDMGLCLIDATHYATENIVIPPLAARLRELVPDAEFIESAADGQVFMISDPQLLV